MRITPAHAGTTLRGVFAFTFFQDHPRSRGDNTLKMSKTKWNSGSPPLTRGQHRSGWTKDKVSGITPAHAGTTILLAQF